MKYEIGKDITKAKERLIGGRAFRHHEKKESMKMEHEEHKKHSGKAHEKALAKLKGYKK